MLRDREKSLESAMSDKGPGGSDRPGDGSRRRKNDSHQRIGQMLDKVYGDVQNQSVPDSLMDILNRIPDDAGSKKERP